VSILQAVSYWAQTEKRCLSNREEERVSVIVTTNFKTKRKKPETKAQAERRWRGEMLAELQHLGNHGWCENVFENGLMCLSAFGLGFAHRVKKRKFPSFKKDKAAYEREYKIAARLCADCHDVIEYADHEEDATRAAQMYDTVTHMHEDRPSIYGEFGIY